MIVVAAGVAYATIPSSGNVYTACMLKGIGTIRLIDPSLPAWNAMSHCTRFETAITWNQHGPAGAPGIPGPQGPAGAGSEDPRAVTAANLHGFVLAPDGDNTPAFGGPDAPGNGSTTFVAVPGAPLGTSVLDMQTVTGKSVATFFPAAGTKGRLLSELTSLGYASKVIAHPNPAYDVTAQIEVVGSTATHFASGYTTVVFEPYVNGESGLLDWHRSDVVHGKVWSTQALPSGDCSQALPCPFSTFVAENPRATVLDAKFRIGQNAGTPATDAGEYQVDDVVYGFGPTVNYDLGG